MSLNRYDAKRDANEPPLAALAGRLGWWLIQTKTPADWLGFFRGRWYPIEIKSEQGILTSVQTKFHREATTRGAPVLIWNSEDDVMAASGARVSA